MAQKPVDKEVAHRFAELVGRGLTQHEAARAVEIGTRTGERLMTKPEIRQIVQETETQPKLRSRSTHRSSRVRRCGDVAFRLDRDNQRRRRSGSITKA